MSTANEFSREPTFRSQQRLGQLAMQYRACREADSRQAIAQEYGRVVEQLISTGNWSEPPAPEDELPDEHMPRSYLEYWDAPA